MLWALFSTIYGWPESNYDCIFRLTVALTNVHIRWHPLWDEDGKTYDRYQKHLLDISKTSIKKRRRSQEFYIAIDVGGEWCALRKFLKMTTMMGASVSDRGRFCRDTVRYGIEQNRC